MAEHDWNYYSQTMGRGYAWEQDPEDLRNTKLYQTWKQYWMTIPIGDERDWAGGRLVRIGKRTARWYSPSGNVVYLESSTPLVTQLQRYPELAQFWANWYKDDADIILKYAQGGGETGGTQQDTTSGSTTDQGGATGEDTGTQTGGGGGTVQQYSSPQAAWEAYWRDIPVGDKRQWAGGTLEKVNDYTAVYTDPQGKTYTLYSWTPLEDIYKASPYIKQEWDKAYGPDAFTKNPYAVWQSYWSDIPVGDERSWAGGTLKKISADTAVYTDPTGQTYTFHSWTPMLQVYQENPYIRAAWDEAYGPDVFKSALQQQASYDIPRDLFPFSESLKLQTGWTEQYSGLPPSYRNLILKAMVPQFLASAYNMPGYIGAAMQQGLGAYKSAMDYGTKGAMQGTLNQLAANNTLNSSVASDALAKAQMGMLQQFAQPAYQTAMGASQMMAGLPQVYGGLLAQLGQASGSSQRSSGFSQNLYADPLAPYRLMNQLLIS